MFKNLALVEIIRHQLTSFQIFYIIDEYGIKFWVRERRGNIMKLNNAYRVVSGE